MVDNVVPTLAPNKEMPNVFESLSTPQAPSAVPEKNALFDSIARDEMAQPENTEVSSLKTVFAGLLWFGYAVAIVVALILVWSAANSLLQSLPH
jgi:hypothetical protein